MITERILQLIELKGITKYKFCKDLGLSNGFLDKPREIATDKYANILNYIPDVNPEWLLTGRGEMLKPNGTSSINQSIRGNNNNIAGGNSKIINENAEFKKENEELKLQINGLLSEQKKLHNQIDKLHNQIDKLHNQIDKLIDKLK